MSARNHRTAPSFQTYRAGQLSDKLYRLSEQYCLSLTPKGQSISAALATMYEHMIEAIGGNCVEVREVKRIVRQRKNERRGN